MKSRLISGSVEGATAPSAEGQSCIVLDGAPIGLQAMLPQSKAIGAADVVVL